MAAPHPAISVVIPTHNDAAYLKDSVASVFEQHYPGEIEVVIVDDGSDPAADTIYQPDRAEVRIVRQECGGVSSARNTGIRESRHNMIAFLDADDRMLPGRLKDQITVLQSADDIGLVGGDITRVDQDGNEDSWGVFEAFGVEIPAESLGEARFVFDQTFCDLLLEHYPFNGSVMLARRDALPAPDAFDTDLPCWEDWDSVVRVAQHWRVGYVRRPVALYRKRPGSITTSADPRKFLGRARMFARWGRDFNDLTDDQRTRLRAAQIESLLTAAWEYRATNRAAAFDAARRAFLLSPSARTLKAAAGSLLGGRRCRC